MERDALLVRTKAFALRVMKLVEALPKGVAWRTIGHQLLRAATSVGADYRAAQRGRPKAEFVAKLRIVLEEADECCYWLELVIEGGLLPARRVSELLSEADELTAIFVTASKTAAA